MSVKTEAVGNTLLFFQKTNQSIMSSCEYCSASIENLVFKCSYCEENYCISHRVPETHDCPNIDLAGPPNSRPDEPDVFTHQPQERFTTGKEVSAREDNIDLADLRERAKAESQPYSISEPTHTVGKRPDPDYKSSPDVAVDGSVASDESNHKPENQSEEQKGAIGSRLFFLALIILGVLLVGILFVLS